MFIKKIFSIFEEKCNETRFYGELHQIASSFLPYDSQSFLLNTIHTTDHMTKTKIWQYKHYATARTLNFLYFSPTDSTTSIELCYRPLHIQKFYRFHIVTEHGRSYV